MPHKTCSYGDCKSDSRQVGRRWDMDGVFFIPFPKPTRHGEKCQRWVKACGRADFTVENVTRHTYICCKHFVGGRGPTTAHPDPVFFIGALFKTDRNRRRVKQMASEECILIKDHPDSPTEYVTCNNQAEFSCSQFAFTHDQNLPSTSQSFSSDSQATFATNPTTSVASHITPTCSITTRVHAEPKVVKYVYQDLNNTTASSPSEFPSVFVKHDHSSKFLNQLVEFWKAHLFCDASICVDGVEFPFHRLMLVAASPHMKNELAQENNLSHLQFQLPSSITHDAIQCFLHYLYYGILSLSVNNVQSVLRLATIFRVATVQQHCHEFIQATAIRLGLRKSEILLPQYELSIQEGSDSEDSGNNTGCNQNGTNRSATFPSPRRCVRMSQNCLQTAETSLTGLLSSVTQAAPELESSDSVPSKVNSSKMKPSSPAISSNTYGDPILENLKQEPVDQDELQVTSCYHQSSDQRKERDKDGTVTGSVAQQESDATALWNSAKTSDLSGPSQQPVMQVLPVDSDENDMGTDRM